MNNSMNEKERRIYADDLWVRIKKSWIMILVLTLVCGVGVNVLGYMRSNVSNETHLDQTADEIRGQLSEEEIRAVDKVLGYKQQIRSIREYMDGSVLMNGSGVELSTEKLIYSSSSPSSAVVRSCYEVLTGKQFLQQLAREIDWTKNAAYLAELIHVEGVNEEKAYTPMALAWDGYVYISLYGTSAEQAAQIADFTQEYLTADKLVGGDIFTLVSRTQTETIDTSVLEKKADLESVLTTATTTCSTAQASLSRLQKDLLAKEMEELGFAEEETADIAAEEQSASVLQPKYLVLGLLFGLILGVLVVILRYMLSKNIRSAKDLQDLAPFDYVAQLSETDEQAAAMFAAYMQTFCEKRQLEQVTFLTSKGLQPTGADAMRAVQQVVERGGIKTALCTMDARDPAMLKEILTARCIVPVVEVDETACDALVQELRICRREDIPTPACIVL